MTEMVWSGVGVWAGVGPAGVSAVGDEFADSEASVAGYEAQEIGVDVAAAVDRHGRAPSVGVSEPFVRAALTKFTESDGLRTKGARHFVARACCL